VYQKRPAIEVLGHVAAGRPQPPDLAEHPGTKQMLTQAWDHLMVQRRASRSAPTRRSFAPDRRSSGTNPAAAVGRAHSDSHCQLAARRRIRAKASTAVSSASGSVCR
jgi:hypothetical protein